MADPLWLSGLLQALPECGEGEGPRRLLPPEVLELVLRLLPPRALKAAVLVCRAWRAAGEAPGLWAWARPRAARRRDLPRLLPLLEGRLRRVGQLALGGVTLAFRDSGAMRRGVRTLIERGESPLVG
jgi:hypothetical protein